MERCMRLSVREAVPLLCQSLLAHFAFSEHASEGQTRAWCTHIVRLLRGHEIGISGEHRKVCCQEGGQDGRLALVHHGAVH